MFSCSGGKVCKEILKLPLIVFGGGSTCRRLGVRVHRRNLSEPTDDISSERPQKGTLRSEEKTSEFVVEKDAFVNIVYLTSEAVPFAKTGGLADVCGTLPRDVASLGHRCAIILPAFRSVFRSGVPVEATDISFAIPMMDGKLVAARLLKSRLPGSTVPVWLIDQPQYFDRDSFYGDSMGDYQDNAARFAFYCRASLAAIERLGMDVDVVHCNDWQSGLVPALIKATPESFPNSAKAATILTIHNMAYQGQFGAGAFPLTGLGWEHFLPESFEFYGNLNFLKAGIATADRVTTVSPRYAMEISTPQHGCGLDEVLRARGLDVDGIINGIDPKIWDPATDRHLDVNFGVEDWKAGKAANKRALQVSKGLEVNQEVPMVGLVGRLADQKGWDLILPVISQNVSESRPVQWVILGSGDPRIEEELRRLSSIAPNQVAVHLGFDEGLAHRIEAASDLFVMPSHYEPCGLNQLYSLKYGAVPVVNPTGGLADTVVDTNAESIETETATGFYLDEVSPRGLDEAIGAALHIRYHRKNIWENIVRRGMSQDWSWRKSASRYVALYENAASLS